MPKKIKFESYKYQFLIAAEKFAYGYGILQTDTWQTFVSAIKFNYYDGEIEISWSQPTAGQIKFSISEPHLYVRGDSVRTVAAQLNMGIVGVEDPIKLENNKYFEEIVMRVVESAGFLEALRGIKKDEKRIEIERHFHDTWASSEDVESINVRLSNEVCTAPEIRYIVQQLGDLTGKSILDVGCGLGEASVYFAMLGAEVTSLDLSQGMLDATARLASANNVNIKQHLASAEDMQLPAEAKFNIIYAGNLLHHVDIEATIIRIKPHLKSDGVFVSWDPLAYNPAINLYRLIATEVRTPDEHPLKWGDIKLFQQHFQKVKTRYFWLTTLTIFVIMVLVQRRNPNKERFWKTILYEGHKWAWLYKPLAILDSLLLSVLAPLRLLCWNVVIIASDTHNTSQSKK